MNRLLTDLPPGVTVTEGGLDRSKLTADLKDREGLKLMPYKNAQGVLTIGYGRNLEANGIRIREAEFLLQNDLDEAIADLDLHDPSWRMHPAPVKRAMVELVFNLGWAKWLKFIATRAALHIGDYKGAAGHLRDSAWYHEAGGEEGQRGWMLCKQIAEADG